MPRIRQILVRGVNWLGDAVMTLPALMRLHEAHPHAGITILTREKLADFWYRQPVVTRVRIIKPSDSLYNTAMDLKEDNYDAALIFPNSPRAALEVWLAGIPRRIGYAAKWRRLFLTQALPQRPGHVSMYKRSSAEIKQRLANEAQPDIYPSEAHHIHQYLHLASALGADPTSFPPYYHVPYYDLPYFQKKFKIPRDLKRLAIIPGAEYGSAKRWPTARFIEVANALHEKYQTHTMILGGFGDESLALDITAGLKGACTNLAGKTTLRELAAMLAASDCVLTNDTGPMHLAAAIGTPVVALFGSTSPDITAPSHGNTQVVQAQPSCAPCFLRECPVDLRCQNDIQTAAVIAAVEKKINL